MSDIAATLAALQFGDSFFPSGSVSFSWGLEGLTENGAIMGADGVGAFVIGQLRARWADFDRCVVAAAHRANANLEDVAAIDRQVELQTPCAEFRRGSRRMGDAMLSTFGRLGLCDALTYRETVKRGGAHGHVAAMQGYLWGRAGLTETDAIALSGHTFCIGLLGAGVRLGCLSHIDAQRVIIEARREIARLAALPLTPVDAVSSYAIEAEIAVMQHGSSQTRVFAN